jgi:hypothetical protein
LDVRDHWFSRSIDIALDILEPVSNIKLIHKLDAIMMVARIPDGHFMALILELGG